MQLQSPLDFNRLEALNARLQNLGVDPGGLAAGDKGLIWIDGAGVIKYWDGAATQTLGLATGGNAETLDGQDGTFYLARDNHTGTQAVGTITGLGDLATKNTVGTADIDNDAVTLAKLADLPTGTLLGRTTAGAGDAEALTAAQARALLNVEDGATADQTKADIDALGVDAATVGGATPANLRDRATHTGTQPSSTVSDFAEATDDRVSALIVAGNQISKVYDDVGNTLTIAVDEVGLDADTVDGYEGAALEKIASKGVADGYASLDGGGKVPSAQLPALALTDVNVVADITARDALVVQEGDVAIVQSDGKSYIYDGAAWQELTSPVDGVQSVTGTAPIVSSGGTNPAISLAAGGVATAHIGDAQVTAVKLANDAVDLSTATVTGTLSLAKGGTGATTAAVARANLGATTKVSANIGDGAATEITVVHNLNTRDVQVEVARNSTPWDTIIVDIERPSVNSVLLRFATAPAADAFRCVVVG